MFKREYITVIESALSLSESVFEARRAGYYDFSDYTAEAELVDPKADCSLAVNASNLQITKVAIKITRAYNAKQMASEYENYWKASQNFHKNIVKRFENNTLVISTDVKQKLNVWQDVYEMFKTECETLENIMGEIDVWELSQCGNNAEEYAKITKKAENKTKAEYYLNFYKNVSILQNYTEDIFN